MNYNQFISLLYNYKLKYHVVDIDTPGLIKVVIFKRWWQSKSSINKRVSKFREFLSVNMPFGIFVEIILK